MLKTILFVVACACASKPESLTVGANSINGKNCRPRYSESISKNATNKGDSKGANREIILFKIP